MLLGMMSIVKWLLGRDEHLQLGLYHEFLRPSVQWKNQSRDVVLSDIYLHNTNHINNPYSHSCRPKSNVSLFTVCFHQLTWHLCLCITVLRRSVEGRRVYSSWWKWIDISVRNGVKYGNLKRWVTKRHKERGGKKGSRKEGKKEGWTTEGKECEWWEGSVTRKRTRW